MNPVSSSFIIFGSEFCTFISHTHRATTEAHILVFLFLFPFYKMDALTEYILIFRKMNLGRRFFFCWVFLCALIIFVCSSSNAAHYLWCQLTNRENMHIVCWIYRDFEMNACEWRTIESVNLLSAITHSRMNGFYVAAKNLLKIPWPKFVACCETATICERFLSCTCKMVKGLSICIQINWLQCFNDTEFKPILKSVFCSVPVFTVIFDFRCCSQRL